MGKNTGKVREFCQSGKVGTLQIHITEFLLMYRPRKAKLKVISELKSN